ncbi:MAG: hypothetical protein LQ339_006699 [Xanthoria mediterranea]|nr:MAG: hypothetical protein LQ339_006699 [Xanthoria mediterranea]
MASSSAICASIALFTWQTSARGAQGGSIETPRRVNPPTAGQWWDPMLQLHVWGPAFSLPSIDPQCLAAIAYLSQAVPPTQWELIASSDPTLSPTKANGNSIETAPLKIERISPRDCSPYQLPSEARKLIIHTHIFSYTSFLETHAQPLIDLNLYVSSENYHASTRPAYSHILLWPNTWLLPPQRRAAAKARTNHLNFSSLDLDTVDQEEEDKFQKSQFAAGAEIPTRLIPRTTASLAKRRGHHAARFRLDRLAEGCLEPLNDLLKGKPYLLSSDKQRMTSLDCLALGYLALALVPAMPQPWLANKIKGSYPDLCRYVDDGVRACFAPGGRDQDRGRDGDFSDGTSTTRMRGLPWQTPTSNTTINLTARLLPLLSSLPLFGPLYRPAPLQPSSSSSSAPPHQHNRIPLLPSLTLGLTASVAAFGLRVLWTGEVPSFDWVRGVRQRHRFMVGWPFGAGGGRVKRLAEMGEAGRVLGGARV